MAEPHLLLLPRRAQLEEALDGVEGVDGDRGGADRRDSRGRMAGEHVVPERLAAASGHRGGLEVEVEMATRRFRGDVVSRG